MVPELVTGPPLKVRPVLPPDTSTDVTVPVPDVAAHVKTPEPSVVRTSSALPSSAGNVQIIVLVMPPGAGALNPT